MTPEQIEKVQQSFGKIALNKTVAAEHFYDRLFALDPKLRALFKGSMGLQGEKLMMTLALAVRNLKAPGSIEGTLQELGRRHRGYGVKDMDYDTVALALLWALEKNLGEDFSPDVKQAWTAMYVMVANTMKAA